jgi:hypothetical protein
MIEIKPVAYAPREDWSRFDSESRLFPLWEVERDAANPGYYEPLYDQQAIDSLMAEVEKWKSTVIFGQDGLSSHLERVEAEAEALRKRVDALEDGLRVAATNLSHYGHHAASKRALWFIDSAKQDGR